MCTLTQTSGLYTKMLGFNSFFSVQACRQGLVQHLEHLLFYGADMDVQNASGNTALHVCALHNRVSNRNYSDKQCFQLGVFMQFFFWIKHFWRQIAVKMSVIAAGGLKGYCSLKIGGGATVTVFLLCYKWRYTWNWHCQLQYAHAS